MLVVSSPFGADILRFLFQIISRVSSAIRENISTLLVRVCVSASISMPRYNMNRPAALSNVLATRIPFLNFVRLLMVNKIITFSKGKMYSRNILFKSEGINEITERDPMVT
jgi:hypothetical protein